MPSQGRNWGFESPWRYKILTNIKYEKKVALVNGGALGYKNGGSSIGGESAIRLAKDGFSVVVFDLLEMGQKTTDLINENGGSSFFVQGDAVKTEDVKKVISIAKEKFGGLNCLVNCVARYSSGMAKSINDITEEEWDKTLNVNLNGYFHFAKYSIPEILKSGGGTIINTSSVGSFTSLPNFSVYSVSKGAVDALTRSLAVDFAPMIRTNSVCPGFVKIANSENNRTQEELKKWYAKIAKQYPMKRVCEAKEIASVISFLASEDSSFINGQTIIVDGGKIISDSHQF